MVENVTFVLLNYPTPSDMKRNVLIMLLVAVLHGITSAQVQIQMPLPAQNGTFSGSVRGYWFISPSCFTITAVQVPFDAAQGNQSIAIVKLNAPPPLYSTTTNDFTTLFLTQSNPDTGRLPVNIQVAPGDIIGLLGYRQPVSGGSGTNSYSTSPATSNINGIPVTIQRLGMQFDLTTTAPQDLWTEAAGSISRVFLYYDTTIVVNTAATWQGGFSYSFSNGIGAPATSVWDYGDGSPLDTAVAPTHTYSAPGTYTICSYVTGVCSSDTSCTTITICSAPALSDFGYTINYPDVTFSDQSQNATAWSWDFGDGATSTAQSPSHTFSTFGLYTVCLTVTDICGQQHTRCENISVCPSIIPVSLGTDVTACGSTTLSLPGYTTYNWSSGDTTQTTVITQSGDYSVIVTDQAGCSGADTVNVIINPLPAAALGSDIVKCGGVATIGVNQASGTTYLWNNGASSSTITIGTGTFTLTVTDSLGCTNKDTISVTINPVPSVFLGNDYNGCQNFIAFSGPSGSGITYNWNTGATTQSILTNQTGSYWLIATNQFGCSDTDTVSVIMNAPAVSYVETQTLVCINNGSITLTPGTPTGGTYSGPGVTGTTFDPVAAGLGNKNIVYSWTDTTGCIGRDTSVITVSTCAGIGEIGGNIVSVYPNPGNGVFTVDAGITPDLVEVKDLMGRDIFAVIPADRRILMDISNAAAGVYTLNIRYKSEVTTLPIQIVK